MKHRKLILAILAFLMVGTTTGGTFFLFTRKQCIPEKAMSRATAFLTFMIQDEAEKAWELTDKKLPLSAFNEMVEREWKKHGGRKGDLRFSFTNAFPFQSCGNRWSRRLRGKVEMDTISLDFLVQGHPFEVRLRSDQDGEWTVIYFQIHAADNVFPSARPDLLACGD